MVSYYRVIKYIPDEVAGECINIGVVTYGEGQIHYRFLRNWQRVKSFSGHDTDGLRRFADDFERGVIGQRGLESWDTRPVITEEYLRTLVTRFSHSIQFSEERASLEKSEVLLADLAPLMLKEKAKSKVPRNYLSNHDAQIVTHKTVQKAVQDVMNDTADRYVRFRGSLEGACGPHPIGTTIQNGHIVAAVESLSFEGPHLDQRENDIRGRLWNLQDVRERNPDLSLAVTYYPPEGRVPLFDEMIAATRLYNYQNVPPDRVDAWARLAAQKLLGSV